MWAMVAFFCVRHNRWLLQSVGPICVHGDTVLTMVWQCLLYEELMGWPSMSTLYGRVGADGACGHEFTNFFSFTTGNPRTLSCRHVSVSYSSRVSSSSPWLTCVALWLRLTFSFLQNKTETLKLNILRIVDPNYEPFSLLSSSHRDLQN